MNTTRQGLPSALFTTVNWPSAAPPSLPVRSKYQDSAGAVDHDVEQLPVGQVTQPVVWAQFFWEQPLVAKVKVVPCATVALIVSSPQRAASEMVDLTAR